LLCPLTRIGDTHGSAGRCTAPGRPNTAAPRSAAAGTDTPACLRCSGISRLRLSGLRLRQSKPGLTYADVSRPSHGTVKVIRAHKPEAAGSQRLKDCLLEISVATRQQRHPRCAPEEVAYLIEWPAVVAIVEVVKEGFRIESTEGERLALLY